MTYTNCDPALALMGPFMTLAGAFAAYLGLLAWFKPNAKIVQDRLVNRYPSEQEAGPILSDLGFTRELLGPVNMFMFKILGPVVGATFVTVGLWVVISQVHCGEYLPDLKVLWGPLSWHRLDVLSWFFVIGAGLIGAWNARLMRPSFRALCILLSLLFGVAASEAAAIHVGMQANRWGAVAFLAIALVGVLNLVRRWLTPHTSTAERNNE
jgi:hypothetical protein